MNTQPTPNFSNDAFLAAFPAEHPAILQLVNQFEPDDVLCIFTVRFAMKDGEKDAVRNNFIRCEDVDTKYIAELTKENATHSIYIAQNTFPASCIGEHTGRTTKNVQVIRAVYAEVDEDGDNVLANLLADSRVPTPHLILESSPHKFQFMWYVKGFDVAEAESLNRAIAAEFGCDPAATDAARVLRLAGFANSKYAERPIVRVVQEYDGPRYQPSDFKLESVVPPKKPASQTDASGERKLVPPGRHHEALLEQLGRLWRQGYPHDAAYAALLAWGKDWLENPGHGEPLEDHIKKMVGSAENWKRGNPAEKFETNQNPHSKSGTSPTIYEPILTTIGDVTMEPINWLWHEHIALGKITLFAGNPDNGKSLATVSVAATVSAGRDWPDAANTIPPSNVLMLIGEDDIKDTVAPRLYAAGADVSRIQSLTVRKQTGDVCEDQDIQLDVNLPIIEKILNENKSIRLLIIDPISSYLGGIKMVDEQGARQNVLGPLKRLAETYNISIVMVMHLNKKSDLDAINRVGGAMAFVGVSRCSWLFTRDEMSEDEDAPEGTNKNASFSMTLIKNNLVKSRDGLSFTITAAQVPMSEEREMWAPYIVWGGAVEQSADTALGSKRRRTGGRPKGTNDKLQEARRWLETSLRDGAKPPKELIKAALENENISRTVLYKAAEILKVVKLNGTWMLSPVVATTETVTGDESVQVAFVMNDEAL